MPVAPRRGAPVACVGRGQGGVRLGRRGAIASTTRRGRWRSCPSRSATWPRPSSAARRPRSGDRCRAWAVAGPLPVRAARPGAAAGRRRWRARPALRGLRAIARQRHAALLVIDPCWDEGSPQAAALPARGLRARPAARPGVHHGHVRAAPRRRGAAVAAAQPECAPQRRQVPQGGCRGRPLRPARPTRTRSPRPSDASYRDAGRDRRAPRLRGRAATRRVPQPGAAALIEAGHASLWVASHEGRELAHTLVHHSGDRAVLFEAGEADTDAAGRRRGRARGTRGSRPTSCSSGPSSAGLPSTASRPMT